MSVVLPILGALLYATLEDKEPDQPPTARTAGWMKSPNNPVLGRQRSLFLQLFP